MLERRVWAGGERWAYLLDEDERGEVTVLRGRHIFAVVGWESFIADWINPHRPGNRGQLPRRVRNAFMDDLTAFDAPESRDGLRRMTGGFLPWESTVVWTLTDDAGDAYRFAWNPFDRELRCWYFDEELDPLGLPDEVGRTLDEITTTLLYDWTPGTNPALVQQLVRVIADGQKAKRPAGGRPDEPSYRRC